MSAIPPLLPGDSWPGATLITGGKGYVQSLMGQLHYRDIGPRGSRPVFLLLHQSQMFLIQYGEIQDQLAALGYRSIAVDTPGHGMSDAPPFQPTVEQFADNLIPLLDQLQLEQVIAAGHHSGTAIAVALAAGHPDRVSGVILQGSVLFTPEERDHWRGSPQWDRTPKADGSHMGAWFRPFPGDMPDDPATLRSRTWMAVSLWLMGPDIGKPAVFAYDMAGNAAKIACPGQILTDLGDMIHPLDERMARLRPDFAYRVMSEGGAMTQMNQPAQWAKAVAEFAATLPASSWTKD